MPDNIVLQSRFSAQLRKKLGNRYSRALRIFKELGPKHSLMVTHTFTRAVELGKVPEALEQFEKLLHIQPAKVA